MNSNCLILALFIIIPIIVIIFLATTSIRYSFIEKEYLAIGIGFGALVVAFILLYAVQKFDNLVENTDVFINRIGYLAVFALEFDPPTLCLLIDALKLYGFGSNAAQNLYSLNEFEILITQKVTNPVDINRIEQTITQTNNLLDLKFGGNYDVPEAIWYLVFTMLVIITIIFVLNCVLRPIDAIFTTLLVWLPLAVLVYLYTSYQNKTTTNVSTAIDEITALGAQFGVQCPSKKEEKPNKTQAPNKSKSPTGTQSLTGTQSPTGTQSLTGTQSPTGTQMKFVRKNVIKS